MPSSPDRLASSVVAIGNFDGVHLGHREVLGHLFAAATAAGAPSCVYTFDPAPTAVVAPERHQPRLQTVENRVALLRAVGVDHVVVREFTPEFAAWSAERFLREELGDRLGARALVVGHDFRFGRMRAGDATSIRRISPGLEVVEVGALAAEGEPISSSRVRKLLVAGELAAANALLGRQHVVSGEVVHGAHRGRTLGFPTANVAMEEELKPAPGVYAVRARRLGGLPSESLPGVANLGMRPTVDGSRYSVEAHLFDFAADLYGQRLELSLVARIREERRFASLDALTAQIRLDAAAARAILA